ncbi:hypothetical protein ACFGXG_09725 [Pasteurella multocida]|uniref:type I restriction endonuclease subunit R, EcoR124 family n=1 Tax=Pasteurella multocida TaxID=747 RepID=UPI0022B2974A|nr:hypothetical protein [Pasteurella multocida]
MNIISNTIFLYILFRTERTVFCSYFKKVRKFCYTRTLLQVLEFFILSECCICDKCFFRLRGNLADHISFGYLNPNRVFSRYLGQPENQTKPVLIEEIRKMIRASVGSRAKESLVVDFIHQTNLDAIPDKASIIDAFFAFAQAEQQKEVKALIESENLNEEAAKRYLAISLKREYASENGTELHAALPTLSPLNPEYRTKKQTVFEKISAFIEKFKGVGGKIV